MRLRVGSTAVLLALLLSGCSRVYYQDISAAQYYPDPGLGNGRAAFKPRSESYAAPLVPLGLIPVLSFDRW